MTKQDLFTAWWILNLFFWIALLSLTNPDPELKHQLIVGLLLLGNLFYFISQHLRDEG